MKIIDSNILITLIFPFYLNVLVINGVRNNPEKFIQENPTISGDEFTIDDRILNFNYYDADISELKETGYSNTIFYDEYPLITSGSNESVLLLIDLPPPEHKS